VNKAQVACAVVSSPLGQHASPRESSPNPPTRPTAMPPPERPAPKSRRTTKPGSAIKATPVAASIAADSTTSVLVVICYLPTFLSCVHTRCQLWAGSALVRIPSGSVRGGRLVIDFGHRVIHLLLVLCRQLRWPEVVGQLVDCPGEAEWDVIGPVHWRAGIESNVEGLVDRHQ
jgi:hypothetical protein